MADKIFMIILVLNATSLFRFIAPQLGVSIGQVSIALLAFNMLYLFIKLPRTLSLLSRGKVGGWLFVLLIWPMLTLTYSPQIEWREVGLLIYYTSLFLGATVYTLSKGLPAMHRVLTISLGITLFGLVLSLAIPAYFESVAELGDARIDYRGRAFGFFMQPNSLAASTCALFVGWYATWVRKNNNLRDILSLLVFVLMILFTGSRTGMLIAAIICFLLLTGRVRRRISSRRFLLEMVVLSVSLILVPAGMSFYMSTTTNADAQVYGGLNARMQALLSGKLSYEGGLKDDVSLHERFSTQANYATFIQKHPMLGHGFSSDTYYFNQGHFKYTAHSDAITSAMEYGVLYPMAFCGLLFLLFRKPGRRKAELDFESNSVLQFSAYAAALFIVNGGILDDRAFFVVWGLFHARIYCSHTLSIHREGPVSIERRPRRRTPSEATSEITRPSQGDADGISRPLNEKLP